MSSSYLKQKPFQTLHDLVAPGDMDKRLTHKVSSGSCRDQRNHVHHTAVERTGLRAEADLGGVWREADRADFEPVHRDQWPACSQDELVWPLRSQFAENLTKRRKLVFNKA